MVVMYLNYIRNSFTGYHINTMYQILAQIDFPRFLEKQVFKLSPAPMDQA